MASPEPVGESYSDGFECGEIIPRVPAAPRVGPGRPPGGEQHQRERIRVFLRAICESPSVTKAHKAAGIDRKTHYDWMQTVPGYPEAYARAQKIGWESLEAEAVRRAQDGYERPIYQAGKFVGTETCYSDRLAELILKGNIPKYKDTTPAAGGISIHMAVGINAGQQAAAPAAAAPAVEVRALPAVADPEDEFGIALLPSSTPPTT